MSNGQLLDRAEYIEQVYFFRVFRERLEDSMPSQEILQSIQEETLATTNLPKAIDFLRGEIMLNGRLSEGMGRLSHYFTRFQTFIMERAEDDRSRFDQRVALEVLERDAEYRSQSPQKAGMFIFQFEVLARNQLGYDGGMRAIAEDPIYDAQWRHWIQKLRMNLGTRDLADYIYVSSEAYRHEQKRMAQTLEDGFESILLFGDGEGRIARANRGKDPLYLFGALQRQLGYPRVPRPRRTQQEFTIHPVLDQRLQQIEKRLKLLESEAKGGIDLSEFYKGQEPRFED